MKELAQKGKGKYFDATEGESIIIQTEKELSRT